jgi:hypothetical protein
MQTAKEFFFGCLHFVLAVQVPFRGFRGDGFYLFTTNFNVLTALLLSFITTK